jgi:hypothetical protein
LSVTEPQRLALHKAAREALGDEEGDTLMALTPPANTDIATRQDLDRVEERLGMRMVALEDRLDNKFVALEDRLDSKFVALEDRLNGKMGALEERNRSHTWKVVVGTGVVLYLATAATLIAGLAVLVQVLNA